MATLDDSILDSVKKSLGLDKDYDPFDPDIVMHINSCFFTLNQLGLGPSEGFLVEGSDSVWSEFVPEIQKFAAIKSYVYIKVKLLFDPPATSFAQEAMKQQATEYEWRLQVAADPVILPINESDIDE